MTNNGNNHINDLSITALPGGNDASEEERAARLTYALKMLDDLQIFATRELEKLGFPVDSVESKLLEANIISDMLIGKKDIFLKTRPSDRSQQRKFDRAFDYLSAVRNFEDVRRCARSGDIANTIIYTFYAMASYLRSDAARGALRRITGTDGSMKQEPRNEYVKNLVFKMNSEFLAQYPQSKPTGRARWIERDLRKRLDQELERDLALDPDMIEPHAKPVGWETIRKWLPKDRRKKSGKAG